MKIFRLKSQVLFMMLLTSSLIPISCSSTEESEEGGNLESSEEENAALANEGNENEQYNEANPNYDENYSQENGEEVNNAEGDDLVDNINNGGFNGYNNEGTGQDALANNNAPLMSNDEFLSDSGTGNSFSDPLANNQASSENLMSPVASESFMGNEMAGNSLPANNAGVAMDAGVTGEAEATAPMEDQSASVQEKMPMSASVGGWHVKYATQSISVHRTPDGNVVNQLEEGDHPLIVDENEWARTQEGYYIPQSGLTTDPVGRPRKGFNWQ